MHCNACIALVLKLRTCLIIKKELDTSTQLVKEGGDNLFFFDTSQHPIFAKLSRFNYDTRNSPEKRSFLKKIDFFIFKMGQNVKYPFSHFCS